MKLYCADFNGILTDLKKKIGHNLASPRDADAWIVWQDVLGSFGDLIKAAYTTGTNKPTFVVQHGRASTLDYGPPNSYPLSSDYFLCWGAADLDRMTALGYGNKTHIVGCPLSVNIKPKIEHKEKIVLFVPVNTGKEEPENIAVYYELLKMRYDKAQTRILNNQDLLKDKWGMDGKPYIPFREISSDFDVVAKLLPWHDKNLYHGNTISGSQYSPKNNELIFNLLRNVDAVIGLDEGCTEIFAMAHDVPVIVVDGFKYRQHKADGRKYEEMDIYRTKGATHCTLNELRSCLEQAFAHPEMLKKERAEVAEQEMGISYGDATSNIFKFVKEKVKCLNPAY